MRTVLFALYFLFSSAAIAQNLAGEWRIVEWSAGSHPETVTMLFGTDGTLLMTTTPPGSEPSIEARHYEFTNGELVITTGSGEVTRHALEVKSGRIKVRVPFGFFVIERTPNPAVEARLRRSDDVPAAPARHPAR